MSRDLKAHLTLDPGGWVRGTKAAEMAMGRMAQRTMGVVGKIGRAFTSLPALLATGFVGLNIAKAIGVSAAAEETKSKFAAVYKGLAGENEKFAEGFARAAKRGTTEAMRHMSTFQDTFVPLGFARDQAAVLSQMLTRLGYDLASFNNVGDATAMADLQSALTGQHETMRKYGVIINETTLKAKGLELGLASAKGEMNEQQKSLTRLAIILGSTSDAQGDAERTASSWTNSMKAAAAATTEGYERLGDLITQNQTAKRVLRDYSMTLGLLTGAFKSNEDAA